MTAAPDSSEALALIGAGLLALKAREGDIDRLNVFPVPDGDTGTNMVLTMQSVMAECGKASTGDMAALARAATDGSLMGARGNSGVILSQVIRGLAEVLGPAETLDAGVVSEALSRASEVALKAIRKPVKGTMLTVMEETAEAAARLAADAKDFDEFLDDVLKEAWLSVERTPELLPVLREAGVVDAGGYGLVVLAEGIVRGIRGEAVKGHDELLVTPAQLSEQTEAEELEYAYCTEFLVKGDLPPGEEVRSRLDEMGGSLMVVGDQTRMKVHVHVNDPGEVLSYLGPFGQLSEIHISNMEEQTSERRHSLGSEPAKPLAVVTVAAGPGLAEIMRSLGADEIVAGGQSMNPSIGELAEAVKSVRAHNVIVLPNNKNVLAAAQQLASSFAESGESNGSAVHVVPTHTAPEGLAALIAYEADGEPDEVVKDMTDEVARVVSGAVTIAVRDSQAPVGEIKEGDVIGVSGQDILVVGDSVAQVATDLVASLAERAAQAETLTMLAGEGLADAEAQEIAVMVGKQQPELEVEWQRGDQPHYPVILGLE